MAAKKQIPPRKTPSNSKAPVKAPSRGTKPAKTVKSAKPAKAAKPVAPTKPAKPAKAAKPVAPTKPAKPVAAAKPIKPVAAVKPAKPIKTEAKPAKPIKTEAKPAKAEAKPASPLALLDAGSAAPSFELSDESGRRVSSGSLSGKPYLLYFYPKDDTPGCTKEACDIRDNFGRFGKLGVRVLGVSPDSEQSHAKFGKKYGLPFTLLSDPEKNLANAYGVWGEKSNYGKKYMGIIRSSFLIGADGMVKKAYRGVKVNGHVDSLLQDAQALL